MATVTKKDLIERIAAASGCTRVDVKNVVQCFLDQVIDELAQGNRLEFRDFGVLETRDRAARVAQNPKTLERVNVPPKRTVKFKVGRLLKERLDAYTGEPSAQQHANTSPSIVIKTRSPDSITPHPTPHTQPHPRLAEG